MIYDNIKWYKTNKGYWYNGKHGMLHRYIYTKHNGSIPEGYLVHHDNENKTDNSPKNLIAMTIGEHTRLHKNDKHHTKEAKEKNRVAHMGKHHTKETKKKISEARKGEKHPNAKLTNLDVKWIKMWLSLGYTQQSIADTFNVSRSHIGSIKTGVKRSTAC